MVGWISCCIERWVDTETDLLANDLMGKLLDRKTDK
jgi:hypothetical protein